jgi:muramoyltetrapeptide carboxypeptidase LdcA involved in peptidoglycan recycling
MMKPRALREGDTIGLIAPSSPISDTHADNTRQKIEKSVAALNQQGYNVVVDKAVI